MIVPGFHLGLATASERLARDRLTFEAWGQRLGPSQYLDRERTLRGTDHARLSMHSWVLRLPNGFVVASCETFRLSLQPAGAVEVVASVFVERTMRGARMGSRLMAALVAHRREAGLDGLVLFSEVGTGLYEQVGFRPLPAPTRRVAACSPTASTPGVLAADALPALFALRDRRREGRLDLQLTEPLVDWHLERARFYARTLGRPLPAGLGAIDGEVGALFVPDFKNGLVRVLEASGPPGGSLEGVLAAAAGEAARLGLSHVELWDDAHSRELRGPPALPRADDLPMGRSFTPRGELFLGPLGRACWA